MYQITYNLGGDMKSYNTLFNTVWGAVFKARCLTEIHKVCTDVVDMQYGNILASFAPDGGVYADVDLTEDVRQLVYTPIV